MGHSIFSYDLQKHTMSKRILKTGLKRNHNQMLPLYLFPTMCQTTYDVNNDLCDWSKGMFKQINGGLTLKDPWRCWHGERMRVHRSARPAGTPVYRKCLPPPSIPWARSVGASSLLCYRSPEVKTWDEKSLSNYKKNHSPFPSQHSYNLFLNQDVDPLEHSFTRELVGKVGLDLKCMSNDCDFRIIVFRLYFCH